MTVFSMLETKVLYFFAPCYGFLINWIAKVQMKLTNKCNVMLITEWRLSHYSTIFSDNHSLLPLWYFEWWWLIEWISSLFWVHVEVLSGILGKVSIWIIFFRHKFWYCSNIDNHCTLFTTFSMNINHKKKQVEPDQRNYYTKHN